MFPVANSVRDERRRSAKVLYFRFRRTEKGLHFWHLYDLVVVGLGITRTAGIIFRCFSSVAQNYLGERQREGYFWKRRGSK